MTASREENAGRFSYSPLQPVEGQHKRLLTSAEELIRAGYLDAAADLLEPYLVGQLRPDAENEHAMVSVEECLTADLVGHEAEEAQALLRNIWPQVRWRHQDRGAL